MSADERADEPAGTSADVVAGARPGCRVLHAANMRQPAIGVVRQMEDEQRAAREAGLAWTSRLYCPPGTAGDVVVEADAGSARWLAFKRGYYAWLRDEVPAHDVVLLRYSMYDPLQTAFVRDCPVPVVTMHHTIEVRELMSRPSAKNRARRRIEALVGPLTLRAARAHAGITDEVTAHQRERALGTHHPVIRYSNGAFYAPDSAVAAELPDAAPELLFVSSRFAPWLGLDLIVEAAARTDAAFTVHVAGHLTPAQRATLAGDARFVAHGFVDAAAMGALLARCTIGLSTFGLERKGLAEGDTLKVREYLRAGLPVYAGYRDVFPADFPWYRQGAADFGAVLAYAREVRGAERAAVSRDARPFIDKRVIVERMHAALCALAGADAPAS